MAGTPRAPRVKSAAATPASRLVLDSSCWLEFFAQTDRLDLFRAAILDVEHLIVPVITVYEVYKKLRRDCGEDIAADAAALMQRGEIVELSLSLALGAAANGLPMADSLIYATAQSHHALLWTQDQHFEGLPGVRYFEKTAA